MGPERPQGSPASYSVWREDPGLLSRCLVAVWGFSLWWFVLLSMGSRCVGVSEACSSEAPCVWKHCKSLQHPPSSQEDKADPGDPRLNPSLSAPGYSASW